MKLNFRDLKQQKFEIEAEPTETIGQVKEKIQSSKGEGWEPANLKLIYSGKILQDANTVESYKIEEKGYIVCMLQKPKPAKPAPSTVAEPSTPAPAKVQNTPVPPPIAPSNPLSNIPATPSPAPQTSTSRDSNDPNVLLSNRDERSAAVDNLINMGFDRSDVERAMEAAFYNPDRAVEYLLNGIPESAPQPRAAPVPTTSTTSTSATPATGATTTTSSNQPATQGTGEEPFNMFEAAAQAGTRGQGGAATGGNIPTATGGLPQAAAGSRGTLDFLRDNAQFQQLRQVIQQNPQMLEPILHQLGAANPQLLQLVNNNPEEFLDMLSAQGEDDAVLPPGAQTVSVTEEERDAIERLCRLGFERDLVIQAYFACDKNEELAANFLFDQPEEEDQP